MELTEMQADLREFVSNELLDGETEVAIEDNLLADGMVDSVGVGRLVAYVDERFGYSMPAEDLLIDNLRSIAALSAYLKGRLGESA